jgi:PhnB protein
MATESKYPFFAPQLFINNGVTDISFYKNAFGAVERLRLDNDDGSVHVAEFSINGAIFHVHEVTSNSSFFSPENHNGCTTLIGLFVEDVQEVMTRAINAGATEIKPSKDYEYGYRQGEIKDPFGHHWMIEKKIR